MLKDVLFIARKDMQYMLTAKETMLWVFVMPIVFFFFIGTITGGFAAGPVQQTRVALQAGESGGFLLDHLEARLEEQDFKIVHPDSVEQFMLYSRRLTVPDNFTDSVLAGNPATVYYTYSSDGMGGNYDQIRLQRAVYTVLADLIVTSETDTIPTQAGLSELRTMPRALTLDVKPAGLREHIPTGFEQAIPGIMVMFTLMTMMTSGAILLVIERKQGLLRRLAYTPIRRVDVVLGKWGGKWIVGLVQISFAMLAGTVLFKMNWGPNLPAIILVMFVYGALMAAIGVLLGSLARTENQSIAIGVISANVLAALGGCWWPIEITPDWMQQLQLFLPTGWAMDAMHKLISFGSGPETIIPHVIGMTIGTFVLVLIGSRVFRFD